jgi:hypothetical protein
LKWKDPTPEDVAAMGKSKIYLTMSIAQLLPPSEMDEAGIRLVSTSDGSARMASYTLEEFNAQLESLQTAAAAATESEDSDAGLTGDEGAEEEQQEEQQGQAATSTFKVEAAYATSSEESNHSAFHGEEGDTSADVGLSDRQMRHNRRSFGRE